MNRDFHRLEDVTNDWLTDGIFSDLALLDMPWSENNISLSLNAEYYGNHSGQKIVSPIVNKFLKIDNTLVLSESRMAQLAKIIYDINIMNWVKQYNIYSLEYNPILNYDMSESEIINGAKVGSRTNTGTQTDVSIQDLTVSSMGINNNSVYGFNSVTDVPNENDTSNSSSSSHSADNNTRTDNLSESNRDEHNTTRTLSRSGNIGVTTSQQMIESERNLWLWNYFYRVVFPDVDKILTIDTYSKLCGSY